MHEHDGVIGLSFPLVLELIVDDESLVEGLHDELRNRSFQKIWLRVFELEVPLLLHDGTLDIDDIRKHRGNYNEGACQEGEQEVEDSFNKGLLSLVMLLEKMETRINNYFEVKQWKQGNANTNACNCVENY